MSESSNKIEELRKQVASDPACDLFVDLARLLSEKPETRAEARDVCFKGLSRTPNNLAARLILARLHYLDGHTEFAIRELVELKLRSRLAEVDTLLEAFGEAASPYLSRLYPVQDSHEEEPQEEKVIAEVDLDSEFIDILNDIEFE